MRHRVRRLSRNSAHRKALMRNLALAFLKHELIKTTLPKAKELRPFVEKILTLVKVDSLANRRLLISILGSNELTNKLFTDIGPRIAKRNGGYTRIMRFGFRTGDKAPMAVIELVDRVITEDKAPEEEKPKKTPKQDKPKTDKTKAVKPETEKVAKAATA